MHHRKQHPVLALPAMLAGVLLLGACGGGSSSDSGSLTLGITDAPVDSAQAVEVVFTGITLKPQDGEPITFECDEPVGDPEFNCGGTGFRQIDLLTLSGDQSEILLDGVELAAGRYEWIRLHVNAKAPGSPTRPDPALPGSTIELDSGAVEDLLIPSGPQTGLKLVQGFSVPAGGSASFTIDFVLRRAVVEAAIGFLLRPAFRLVDNSNAGHLVGEITSAFVQTNCPTGDASGGLGVYVHEGFDAATDDIGGVEENEPVTTTRAELDETSGDYDYRIGFLDAGDYTVSVTCEADSNDPETDDDLVFVASVNVTVEAGNEPTVKNFDVTS